MNIHLHPLMICLYWCSPLTGGMLLLAAAMVVIVVLPLLVAAGPLVEVFGLSMTVELLGHAPNVKREPADEKKIKPLLSYDMVLNWDQSIFMTTNP